MNKFFAFIFLLAISSNFLTAQSDSTDDPLLPQNDEFFEGFAEQLMESFNIEDLEEQMLQLSEQMMGYSDGFENEPYQWIDSLKNGMKDGKGFFFLDPNGGDQLGFQFDQIQEMLKPMLDSMMNGGMFQQFNFGDMGDMPGGGMFDMKQFFGDGNMEMPDFKNFGGTGTKTFADKIEAEMWKDNLFQEEDINKVEITGKHLKVNGVKQPQEVFEKYRDLFEQSQGHGLTDDSTIKLNFSNERPNKKKRVKTQRI